MFRETRDSDQSAFQDEYQMQRTQQDDVDGDKMNQRVLV